MNITQRLLLCTIGFSIASPAFASTQCHQVQEMYIEAVHNKNINAQRTLYPILKKCAGESSSRTNQQASVQPANYDIVAQMIDRVHSNNDNCRDLASDMARTDDEIQFTQLHHQWMQACSNK